MKLLTKVAGKVGSKSPVICIVLGTGAVVGSIVLAHRAGRKVEETIDINKEHIDNIKSLKDAEEIENEEGEKVPYSQKDYKRDLTKAYTGCAWDFAKLYLPPIVLGIGGILCFVKGYRIIGKRLAKVTAAYEVVNSAFNKYRRNVIDFDGEEKDKQYLYGIKKAKNIDIETVDPETGESSVVKSPKGEEFEIIDDPSRMASPYAVLLDDCAEVGKDLNWNEMYIKGIEDIANNKLNLYGKVYLIEVYDALGLRCCLNEKALLAAQEVGWLKDVGDGYIKLDLKPVAVKCKRTNGKVVPYEKRVLVDFNCCGNILEILKKREYGTVAE